MAIIRPKDLTRVTVPDPADATIIDRDGAAPRSILLTDAINSVRPYASEAEAVAGVLTNRVMSPAMTVALVDAKLPNTATGRSVLAAPDAAAGRTALGLGTAAVQPTTAFAPASHVGSGGSEHAVAIAGEAAGFLNGADKSKLDGVASGATANSSDAQLRDRTTHTGTQLASTISDFSEAVDDRVAVLIVAGSGVTKTYDDTANTLTISANPGGLPDGDKGDITVSGGGGTWIVDNGAITNIKLANVPTSTIKGRATAGLGSPEDLTAEQVKTLLGLPPGVSSAPLPNTVASALGEFKSYASSAGSAAILPSGGTWAYQLNWYNPGSGVYYGAASGVAAGGATVGGVIAGAVWQGFIWRVG